VSGKKKTRSNVNTQVEARIVRGVAVGGGGGW